MTTQLSHRGVTNNVSAGARPLRAESNWADNPQHSELRTLVPRRQRSRSRIAKCAATVALSFFAVACSLHVTAAPQPSYAIPVSAYQALRWRSIGPFRGGRTTAVAGNSIEPYTFFIGSSGGGVWKTTDAGNTWKNISDGWFKVGSIGAIAVAPSNANTIYVGTGEASVRNHSTSPGDGMYKSINGGKTWTRVGLNRTLHIAQIAVSPTNPDVLYVAAQGNPWKPTTQRGVYKSIDGGRTWKRVLFVNGTTGAHSVSLDPKNPTVVFASMWDYRREPWHMRSGGPGSGLWKSTDGGAHWTRLTNGLPQEMGISAISVSPADPEWVYAMIEAPHGGVFRSEDGGARWQRVNSDRGLRTRAWYYTIIATDPINKAEVYVLGDGGVIGRSTDGGKEFTPIRVPHGDNHAIWINPQNDQIMVEGNDGGGTVTLNGGRTWTTENNQPTGQFYRAFLDNGFPFRVYGSQQDAGTASVPSRSSNFRGINVAEEYTVGGGEDGHVALNLAHPNDIYGAGMLGSITRYNHRTGQVRDVTPWPDWAGFRVPSGLKYRFNWSAPIVASQFSPGTVYMGAQVVLESTDKGESWHAISPDLTSNNKAHQGPEGGIFSVQGGGYQAYDTIVSLVQSHFNAGTIWAGSDDGYVHVTRDGGANWLDVTPKAVRAGRAYVRSIAVSAIHAGTAYVAANRYRFGDFRPTIYITHNYGRSWTVAVKGIPSNQFVEVVRSDPVRPDLLYAGTDRGAYVSFNGGALWQSLQLNLPAVPITDLRVHDNDLVASTQGRSFWILDGLSQLRQLNPSIADASIHLFKPATAYRIDYHFSMLVPGPFGTNPPSGAVIHYSLAKSPTGRSSVTMDILDSNKKVIATFTSNAPTTRRAHLGHFLKGGAMQAATRPLPTNVGMNTYAWNMRTAPYVRTDDVWHYVDTRPYEVAPGTYYVRLTYGGTTETQSFAIKLDPNYATHPSSQWATQQGLLASLTRLVNTINRTNNQLRSVAAQIKERLHQPEHTGATSAKMCAAGYSIVQRIGQWEQQAPQAPLPNHVQDNVNWSARSFSIPVMALVSLVDQGPPLTAGQVSVARLLERRWANVADAGKSIVGSPLASLNRQLVSANLKKVVVPAGDMPAPVVPAFPANFCAGGR